MNYYGTVRQDRDVHPLRRINSYLVRWARRKFQRLTSYKARNDGGTASIATEPGLFAHWEWTSTFRWIR